MKRTRFLLSLLVALTMMAMSPQRLWASTHYDAGYASSEWSSSTNDGGYLILKLSTMRIWNYQGDNSHFATNPKVDVTVDGVGTHTLYLNNLYTISNSGEGDENPFKNSGSKAFSNSVTYDKTSNNVRVAAYFKNHKYEQTVSGTNNGGGSNKWCTADLYIHVYTYRKTSVSITGSWRDQSGGVNTNESVSWSFSGGYPYVKTIATSRSTTNTDGVEVSWTTNENSGTWEVWRGNTFLTACNGTTKSYTDRNRCGEAGATYYVTYRPTSSQNSSPTYYKGLYQSSAMAALSHDYTNYVYNNDATGLKDGTCTGHCRYCNAANTKTDTDHPKWAYSVSTQSSTYGTVSGSLASDGVTYTVTATPKSGYFFGYWTGANYNTSNPLAYTLTGDKALTAFFATTLTVDVNDAKMGSVTNSGSNIVLCGTKITPKATPNAGYHFVSWSDGSTDATHAQITLTEPTTLTATFAPNQYTISTASNNDSWGSVTAGGTYDYDTQHELTATAATGYHFVKWEDNSTANPRTITVPLDGATYTATFEVSQFTIATGVNNAEWGSVTAGGTYDYNTQHQLTATPASNLSRFKQWSDGNTDNPRTITVGADNATYTAEFEYALTIINNELYGHEDWLPADVVIPASVTSIRFCAFYSSQGLASITIPASVTSIGYQAFMLCHSLSSVTMLGTTPPSLGQSVFNNCSSNLVITVPCEGFSAYKSATDWSDYTSLIHGDKAAVIAQVTAVSNNAAYGTVSVSKTDCEATLTATATTGGMYKFIKWSDGNTDNPRTVTTAGTYTAEFAYALKISNNVVTGFEDWIPAKVVIPSTVTAIGNYAFDGCIALSSVTFAEGSQCTSIGLQAFDGCTNLSLVTMLRITPPNLGHSVFNNCSSNLVITVPCEGLSAYKTATNWSTYASLIHGDRAAVIAQVTAVPNNEAYGTVSVSKTDCEATLTATPATGYHFVSWSDGNTDNPRTVTTAGNYTATFAISQFTIATGVNNASYGSVTAGGTYDYNTELQLTATATTGGLYRFKQWSDGNTDNPRTITVGADNATYTAEFECALTISNNVVTGFESWIPANVVIPSTVTSIGRFAFQRCYDLKSITIPSSVTSIGEGAFQWCQKLSSIAIPASVMAIGVNAFQECNALSSVTFAEGSECASIGNSAFSTCPNLTSISIPASVTSIGEYAFLNCSSFSSVTMPGANPPTLGDQAFANCSSSLVITVPCAGLDDYKSATNWSDYTSLIHGDKAAVIAQVTAVSNNEAYGTVSVSKTDCEATLTATATPGDLYRFKQWSDGNTQKSRTVTTAGTYTAEFECALKISNNVVTGFESWLPDDVVIPSTVTAIGSSAFMNCSNLSSITIPSSVTSIGDYAFYDCEKLASITIPESVTSIGYYAFYNCTGLASVTFAEGSGCTSIGIGAFNSTNLSSITIPASVTVIDMDAFDGCTNLSSVTMLRITPPYLGPSVFNRCSSNLVITVPCAGLSDYKEEDYWSGYSSQIRGDRAAAIAQVTAVSNNEAYGTVSVSKTDCEATLTATATEGDLYRFKQWSDGNTDKSRTVTTAGTYTAEFECALKISNNVVTGFESWLPANVVIPSTVTAIGSSAFNKCPYLSSVTIPSMVTAIGNNAFSRCTNLSSVTFAAGSQCTSIGISAFSDCDNLASITIPASVTSIGGYAFYDCEKLASITIPASVTSIGVYAFDGCEALSSVTFAEGSRCASIGNSAFEVCSNLMSITIPASVTSIGESAFDNCTSLSSVAMQGANPPTLGIDVFFSCHDDLVITVPCAGLSAYKSATSWSDYDSQIHGDRAAAIAQVTAVSNNEAYGTVSVARTDCEATLTATATTGGVYRFKQWSDGNTDKSRTVTTAGTYTAEFECALTIENNTLTACATWVQGHIAIPEGVKVIADEVFSNGYDQYPNITGVTLPSTLTTIGQWAFYYTSIDSLALPSTLTTIGAYAFNDCNSLRTVTIAANSQLRTIGDYAFDGCHNLTSFGWSDLTALDTIGKSAFERCKFSSITLPEGLTRIDYGAFCYNSNLKTMTLPASLRSMGKAFGGCDNLTDIYFLGMTVPTMNTYPYSNNVTTHVPCPALDAYDLKLNSGFSYKEYTVVGNGNSVLSNVTASVSPAAAGTASVSMVADCDGVALTVAANTGYRLLYWQDPDGVQMTTMSDGVSLASKDIRKAGTYTAVMEQLIPCTFTYEFEGGTGYLVVTVDGANDTIRTGCTRQYYTGQTVSVRGYDYENGDWRFDNFSYLNTTGWTSITDLTVSESMTITAHYAYAWVTLTVTVNNAELGNIGIVNADENTVQYRYGDRVELWAQPIGDSHFEGWYRTDDNMCFGSAHDYGEVWRQEFNITESLELEAQFYPDIVSVNIRPNNPAWGSVSYPSTMNYGQYYYISAYPNSDCYFEQWSTGEESPITHVFAQRPIDMVAYFRPNLEYDTVGTEITLVKCYSKLSQSELVIPEGVTRIGDHAFDGCTYIAYLYLPSTIRSFGDTCFRQLAYDYGATIFLPTTQVPTFSSKTFDGVQRLKLKVGCGMASAYQADPIIIAAQNQFRIESLTEGAPAYHITKVVPNNNNYGSCGYSMWNISSCSNTIIGTYAYPGFHFSHWDDGNTNPELTPADITHGGVWTGYFEPNPIRVSALRWATFCFSYHFIMPEGLEGYIVTENIGGTLTVTRRFVPGDIVPSMTPLLIYSTSALAATTEFPITLSEEVVSPITETNYLHGHIEGGESIAEVAGAQYYYKLYNGTNGLGWYWGAEDGGVFALGANKAYLALSAQQAVQAAALRLVPEQTDVTTGLTPSCETFFDSSSRGEAVKVLIDHKIYILRGENLYDMNGRLVK